MIQRKNIDNPPYYIHNSCVYYVPPKCGFTGIKNSGLSWRYGIPPADKAIVLSLRDPVQRLISVYNHHVAQGGFIRALEQYGDFSMWAEDFGTLWINRWMARPNDSAAHFEQFVRTALPDILSWGADFHWNSIGRFIHCAGIEFSPITYIDYKSLPQRLNISAVGLDVNTGKYDVPAEAYRILAKAAVKKYYAADLERWQSFNINTI